MKKAIVSLLLAAAMVMTACSGGKADSRQSAQESSAEAVSKEESPAADLNEEKNNEEKSVEVSEIDDSQTDDEYQIGKYTETGYISEYVGYKFTTPENCVLASQDELAQMAGLSFDILEDDLGKVITDYGRTATIFDLYAAYIDNSANVNITLAPNTMNVTDVNMIAEASLEMLKNMDTMKVEVPDERNTVEIAGKEYLNITVKTSIGEITMTQDLYMALYKDKVVSMTITYLDGYEDERDTLLAAFTEL